MFNLGTWEILLILGVALIFIGPDKLPKVAKSLGKGVRQVRDAMSQVDTEVKRATSEARDMVMADEDPTAPDEETASELAAATAEPYEPVDATKQPDPGPPGAQIPPQPDPTDAVDPKARDWAAHASKGPEGRVAAARPVAPNRPTASPEVAQVEPKSPTPEDGATKPEPAGPDSSAT